MYIPIIIQYLIFNIQYSIFITLPTQSKIFLFFFQFGTEKKINYGYVWLGNTQTTILNSVVCIDNIPIYINIYIYIYPYI